MYLGLSPFTHSFKQRATQKRLSVRVENYINTNLVLLASACIHQLTNDNLYGTLQILSFAACPQRQFCVAVACISVVAMAVAG